MYAGRVRLMDDDLIDLLAACRGGDVPGPRRDALLARLRRDGAFQQAFVDEVRLLGMLKAVQSPQPRWLRLQDELSPAPASEPRGGDGTGGTDEFVRRVLAALPAARPRLRRAAALAAAAAALVAAAGL